MARLPYGNALDDVLDPAGYATQKIREMWDLASAGSARRLRDEAGYQWRSIASVQHYLEPAANLASTGRLSDWERQQEADLRAVLGGDLISDLIEQRSSQVNADSANAAMNAAVFPSLSELAAEQLRADASLLSVAMPSRSIAEEVAQLHAHELSSYNAIFACEPQVAEAGFRATRGLDLQDALHDEFHRLAAAASLLSPLQALHDAVGSTLGYEATVDLLRNFSNSNALNGLSAEIWGKYRAIEEHVATCMSPALGIMNTYAVDAWDSDTDQEDDELDPEVNEEDQARIMPVAIAYAVYSFEIRGKLRVIASRFEASATGGAMPIDRMFITVAGACPAYAGRLMKLARLWLQQLDLSRAPVVSCVNGKSEEINPCDMKTFEQISGEIVALLKEISEFLDQS